jgi:periplasmic divalent cation tolerance protein
VSGAVVVLCTAPAAGANGRLGADDLARMLVEEALAACVNVLPGVRSWFRWEGRVEAADEVLLVAKTTAETAERLRARLLQLHPYQVPEVLEIRVDSGLPAYLQWLAASVTPPSR